MTSVPPRLTVRPLSGPDELDLFCGLSYVLDHELADDLAAHRRQAALRKRREALQRRSRRQG